MTTRKLNRGGNAPTPQAEAQDQRGSDLRIYAKGPGLPEEMILTRIAIVGMSGSGKTQTARKLAEAMMDRNRHIGVFDPMGVWWGLRSSADGQSPGYPIVVFGGQRGDAPLEPGSGETLATAFMEKRFNAIFNMRGWSPSKVRLFTTAFLNRLTSHNQHPVHLFLDEFDIICPQSKSAYSEESREACNNTVRRGRSQAIGATMITQNPQDADKSVLNMADTVIAMRTQGAHPVEAIKKWMGRGLDTEKLALLVNSLANLETGSGWLWSPQNGIFDVMNFLLCKTFDSSKTPRLGESIQAPKVLAAVDLKRLGAEIAASAARVQRESPEYLKKRIAELEATDGTKDSKQTEALTKETVRLKEENVRLTAEKEAASAFRRDAQPLLKSLAETVDRMAGLFAAENPAPAIVLPVTPSPPPAITRPPTVEKRSTRLRGSTSLTNPEVQKPTLRGKSMGMLMACARMYPAGLTEAQMAVQAGMRRTSGTFRTYKSLLTTSGSVEVRDGLYFATELGMRWAGNDIPEAPTSTDEVMALWGPKLRGKSREMLRQLIEKGGEWVSFGDIAEAANIAKDSGTFRTYLSLLKTVGLIETENGSARVNTEALFL